MGSPPHMRGKVVRWLNEVKGVRITPAHAGKSCHVYRCSASCWDHPRACGEKDERQPESKGGVGSPPRMRGKGTSRFRGRCPSRITPAHAGKSVIVPEGMEKAGDHPRACGEKWLAPERVPTVWGSPPHTRGKGRELAGGVRAQGITPAHAGKRQARPGQVGRPRGSPPHMRGKGFYHDVLCFHQGITPAYAGKRVGIFGFIGGARDHPRICGEKPP